MKASGNGKAIDFYSGLKLDGGPLNPGRKTWAQAVKDQQLNEELDAVNSLKNWEKATLADVDPNYQPSDDSDDENGNPKPPVVDTDQATDAKANVKSPKSKK